MSYLSLYKTANILYQKGKIFRAKETFLRVLGEIDAIPEEKRKAQDTEIYAFSAMNLFFSQIKRIKAMRKKRSLF